MVVNVTSSATLAPMPLVAAYTASKMAIEGFTASLALELEAFNVRAKLVEPGYGPTTRFASNTWPRWCGVPQTMRLASSDFQRVPTEEMIHLPRIVCAFDGMAVIV